MLSIRLSRVGKKKRPAYRIIVCPKHKDPWGDYLENLGFYNPIAQPKEISLKVERIKYWLSQGAQATPTVHNLLVNQGIIKDKKKKASRFKPKKKQEEREKEPASETTVTNTSATVKDKEIRRKADSPATASKSGKDNH